MKWRKSGKILTIVLPFGHWRHSDATDDPLVLVFGQKSRRHVAAVAVAPHGHSLTIDVLEVLDKVPDKHQTLRVGLNLIL